ncbi:MAG: 4Fe-4S binding protein, partial [Clostridiales bacterium]|nr:4Fe-4S binding protein [Clostridiales bacterium]
MLYLDFQKANCKNCYKCLRACPVKAIDAQGGQAKIIESRCI